MIEFIFTIDYEIYGNGEGSLKELVYEPSERLKHIFLERGLRFVPFIEVAELERIEAEGADPAIDLVKRQIQDFHREGFELGLHLHPQWYNGQYVNGRWFLDHSEYNLCSLPKARIADIVDRSIAYLRRLLGEAAYTPLSFRAGNWLFQPTRDAATVLASRGIKVDSSVFKGGLQHLHKMDYRRALNHGYYWKFNECVDVPDPEGFMLELPIYTQMVPLWRMFTAKRVGLQRQAPMSAPTLKQKIYRVTDFMRPRHPLKLDFCRMTLDELTRMMNTVLREDEKDGASYRPVIAIGHSKDLVDYPTVESFLSYLKNNNIAVTTTGDTYRRCMG